jgi:hypothetical protein
MIRLDGLTHAQVDLCERIWRCRSTQAFERLLDQLTPAEQLAATVLLNMIVQEAAEEELAAMDRYPAAEQLIAAAKKG